MNSEKKENRQESCVTIRRGPADGSPPLPSLSSLPPPLPPPPAPAPAPAAPDSPIDLSQLSTRYRSVDLTNRSVSESCLAPAAAAAKKRRIQGFKDPLPPPSLVAEHRAADTLKYRSMSHADIAGYRTPWLSGDLPDSAATLNKIQPKASIASHVEKSASALPTAAAESLKFRCMSDSRLGGAGHVSSSSSSSSSAFHPTVSSAGISGASSGRKTFMSNSDLLRAATDNSQLEFLLRRTASESFLPSR